VAHREVGDGSVEPSEPDGWTNEKHYQLRIYKLFFNGESDVACLHVERLMTINGLY
jgi:stress-induced morphogen